MTQSTRTWIVVADASKALVYQYVYKADPWKLVEHLKADGSGAKETRDFGPKASEHKGALHGHGDVNPKETKERHLAHSIARTLEQGMVDNMFGSIALVAAPKLLGELRENLSRGLQEKVVVEINKDLTHLTVEDIATKLRPDLPPF